jgi:hypothetical protein
MKNGICHLSQSSDVWCVNAWATKEPHAKSITFVPVRDGAEARTFMQSGYVLNTIAEQLASMGLAQKDLFATTDLPNKTY